MYKNLLSIIDNIVHTSTNFKTNQFNHGTKNELQNIPSVFTNCSFNKLLNKD